MNCGAWNTLKTLRVQAVRKGNNSIPVSLEAVNLSQIKSESETERLVSGLTEIDRVLGGGFFPGSVVLLAGEPGIGKSTILLTLSERASQTTSVMYVSGEESADQIGMRVRRLKLSPKNFKIVTTTDLDALINLLEKEQPKFVIIDSIQTMATANYPAPAGSVVQVRESAALLLHTAKATGTTLVLVGHVTKEGVVAGPRTLEHLVDIVIMLEGERNSDLRLLRSVKNRFGPTDEVGILAMTAEGLTEVANPSARFLADRDFSIPGSVVTVVMEGSRPILVEIQALTRHTSNPYPRRAASGFDSGRLELLLAVLSARAGIKLDNQDVFVNVSGGLRLHEPAADLAVALAIASATENKVIKKELAAFGEVGLAGEIRPVPHRERRSDEARRLGFPVIISAKNLRAALTEAFAS